MWHKSFKESLEEILSDLSDAAASDGADPNGPFGVSIEEQRAIEAILKLISEFAPPETVFPQLDEYLKLIKNSNHDQMYVNGFNNGIKAYKQALGVDE